MIYGKSRNPMTVISRAQASPSPLPTLKKKDIKKFLPFIPKLGEGNCTSEISK